VEPSPGVDTLLLTTAHRHGRRRTGARFGSLAAAPCAEDTTASRQGLAVRLGFELEAEADVVKPKLLAAPRQLRTSSSAADDVRKVLQVNGLDDQLKASPATY
jgi:hypothetical protein